MKYPVKHYFRIDPATQEALETLTRIRCLTKSELIRNYVREGVQRELGEAHKQVTEIQSRTGLLKTISY